MIEMNHGFLLQYKWKVKLEYYLKKKQPFLF